jgi:hypothetical protein
MEALFVQTAASMTRDHGTVTLHGLSPSRWAIGGPPVVSSCRSDQRMGLAFADCGLPGVHV